MKLESGELLILAGNQYFQRPIEVYGYRWEVETLFQCLKGREFHMEESRLTDPIRFKKMVALLAIAFCWAYKTGEWKHKAIKPLKAKTHGRLEQSIFRYGLDYLTDHLLHHLQKIANIVRLIVLFLCPPDMLIIKKGKMEIAKVEDYIIEVG